jgi:hypothetical protein
MINWSRKNFNICGKKEKYAEGFLFGMAEICGSDKVILRRCNQVANLLEE